MEESTERRHPTRFVVVGLVLFVLAVVLGRSLLAGGVVWVLFVLALPALLFALASLIGFRGALVMVLAFMVLTLGVRWLLQESAAGWIALLLLPMVIVTAIVVGRVVAVLRRPASGPTDGDDSNDVESMPDGGKEASRPTERALGETKEKELGEGEKESSAAL